MTVRNARESDFTEAGLQNLPITLLGEIIAGVNAGGGGGGGGNLTEMNIGAGVAPAALAAAPAETADWDPWSGGARKTLVRVQTATAGSILKSLDGGTQGDLVILENHGDGSGNYNNGSLLIRHNNTGAPGITVGNNIYCPNLKDMVLPYTASAILYYDDAAVGWIMVGIAAGGRFENLVTSTLTVSNPLTPSALASGTTNDYDPSTGGQWNAGHVGSMYLRLQADAAGSTLAGLVHNAPGGNQSPVKIIQNAGGPLVIAHEGSGSTAAYRFNLPDSKDLVLLTGQSAVFIYDPQGGGSLTTARWRLVGATTGSYSTLTLNKHVTVSPGATENDWEPTGWRTCSVWRVIPTPTTLTGMKEVEAGAIRVLTSYAAGLTIAHQSAGSSSRNRFYCPGGANFTLNAGESATFRYDTDFGAWFVIGWTK